MHFKFDENLPISLLKYVNNSSTVFSQNLKGISDKELAKHCKNNNFVLVTLDKDFSNPVNYPSSVHSGIILLRPNLQGRREVEELFLWFAKKFDLNNLPNKTFIVEKNSVKIRE